MTADQQFIIQLLTLVLPVIATLLAIVSGVVTYFVQHQTQKNVETVRVALVHNTAETMANRVVTLDVGASAAKAYLEANNANVKIQAVQDQLTSALGMPQQSIREAPATDKPSTEPSTPQGA